MNLQDQIIAALKTVYDPEIPINIYEMGLIYKLEVDEAGKADVVMTLTAPNCPVAGWLPSAVERTVREVPGVTDVKLELTFDPPWTKDRISADAKLMLGIEEDVIRPERLNR